MCDELKKKKETREREKKKKKRTRIKDGTKKIKDRERKASEKISYRRIHQVSSEWEAAKGKR